MTTESPPSPANEGVAADRASGAGPAAEPLRILVVDDDDVDRMAVRRGLRAAGTNAEFRDANSVSTALAELAGTPFDCVFLDYQLLGGDGLRVLKEARAAGITTPIVMLTGRDDGETVAELIKAGASDYLNKSNATPDRMAQTMRHVIRVAAAEEQARQALHALRGSEARFRILHETSPDGFIILRTVRDGTGQIVDFIWDYLNPAAERIGGYSRPGVVGARILEKNPGVRESGLFDLYREVIEIGEPRQREIYYGHEGLNVWLRVTAAKLDDDGVAVSFTDITRRKLAEEERERVLDARNRFYATMSHELRTPINAVLGYTDLLLAGAYGDLTGVQLQGIERAHRAAHHLLELVNDVLDLSKLEAGKLELELEEVNIPHLIEDLFTTVRPLAEERGTELRLIDDGCAAPLRTDPRRVRQILLNLISNAIKFGEGQPVDVRCAEASNDGAVIEVIDRGAGIANEHLPRIFEEFVQLSEDRAGTGLGLSISKRLAELLRGRLEAESEIGQGSVFRVVLRRIGTDPVTTVSPG
jgi:PAS domain S-box-containing protein